MVIYYVCIQIESIVLLKFLDRIGSLDLSKGEAPSTSLPRRLVCNLPKIRSTNDIDHDRPKLAEYIIKTNNHHKERKDYLTRAPICPQPKIQASFNNSRKLGLPPQRSQSWDTEFDKFNYLLGGSFDEVDEGIPEVKTKDDEEEKHVIKSLTKLIKEPCLEKRAKLSQKVEHIRENFGLRKSQEVKDAIIEFVKEYCLTPLKDIYYEKKSLQIVNEDGEKKISTKELNKRFPLLIVSLARTIYLIKLRENLPFLWRP